MKKSKLISNVASVLLTGCLTSPGSLSAATSPPSEIDYERDDEVTTMKTFQNMRDVRFCEIFFIRQKGEMNELHVYNPSGLNDMRSTGDSCPDDLLNKVDLPALQSHYQLDGIYLNKPRHWMFDTIKLPVGKIRNTNGMDWYWMAVSHMPADVKIEPGFLTYKRVPVQRKSELIYKAGKPVFLIDDPEGNVWVMKAFRADHGQTYETLKNLDSRYTALPEGYSFRVKELEKDLILRPTSDTATVMQDEFENTFDYMGDGSSNYIP